MNPIINSGVTFLLERVRIDIIDMNLDMFVCRFFRFSRIWNKNVLFTIVCTWNDLYSWMFCYSSAVFFILKRYTLKAVMFIL